MLLKFSGLICCLLFILSNPFTARCQSFRQLTLHDFQGRPRRSGDIVAETACSISMKYDVHASNGVFHLVFHINLELDRQRSWLDQQRLITPSKIAEVLQHEQGHYAISYFEQQELQRVLSQSNFDRNYQSEVEHIFNLIHDKYEQLNLDYDDDTDHSRNSEQQASWNKYFKRRLTGYPKQLN